MAVQRYATDPKFRNRRRAYQQNVRGGNPDAPFVGVDGEGAYAECGIDGCSCARYRSGAVETEDAHCACGHLAEQHMHVFTILRVGDDVLETGRPLTSLECIDFLASRDPSNIYVAYSFNYDVTMMCRGLPAHKIRKLMDRDKPISAGGRKPERSAIPRPLPVDWEGFELDYLPGKMFKVRRTSCANHLPECTTATCRERGTCPQPDKHRRACPNCPRWIEVSDVFSFFQGSFVSALKDWGIGTEEERQVIASGKNRRSTFSVELDNDTRDYNRLEIELLERLMRKFRAELKGIGHVPSRWQGPGGIAEALLQDHRIPRKKTLPIWPKNDSGEATDDPLSDPLLYAANYTYFGGRFETASIGHVPGPVYAFDINSAYPHALTHAPCLTHGRWIEADRPRSPLYIAVGSFKPNGPANTRPDFYGFPFREKTGGVSWPGAGTGYYWSMEIEAAQPHQSFKVGRAWSYVRECSCEPFAWVPALYAERQKLGKSERGKVLKLALNSLYGKMCQRAGSGPYNNFIWSGFITAYVRARLLDFIHSLPGCTAGHCGGDVHMLATDGVFASAIPPQFKATKELGGWDVEVHPDGMFIVQSGLYFGTADAPKEKSTKSRGTPQNRILEYEGRLRQAYADAHYAHTVESARVTIPLPHFYSLREANARHRLGIAGKWETLNRDISFSWQSKREPEPTYLDSHIRTDPYPGAITRRSVAYSKGFGDELEAAHAKHGSLTDLDTDWQPFLGPPDTDY